MNTMLSVSAEAPAERTASARWALAGLALSMLLASLGISIANVALPALSQAFGAAFQDVQWVVLAYLLSLTALIVGAGRIGDIVGRRRMLIAGLLLFTAASAACAAAPTLWLLIAARAAQGLGAAAMMALTIALVGEAVPKARLGSAMGLLGMMSAIGTALGPSLGGLLIAALGWPAIFFVSVPLGITAITLAFRGLPAERPAPRAGRPAFDAAGTLLLALTLAAYALAMTMGRGNFGLFNAGLLLAALAGAGLFIRVERRAAAPLLSLDMIRAPGLRAGLAMSAIVATVMMATLVVGPFYLSLSLGLDATMLGFAVSVGPIVAALTGLPAGRLVDRFGAGRVTIAGLGGIAAGSLALAALPSALGVAGYVGPIVIVTAGYALFQTANNTAIMADVGKERRGLVSGMLNLSRNLGLVTGVSVMGAVFALASGSAGLVAARPDAVAAGMRITFAVAAALIAIALAVAAGSRAVAAREGAR